MRTREKKLKCLAKEKYPGSYVVFTGQDSAVVIMENGETHRIARRKEQRFFPWTKLAAWSVPAVIWFWELFFAVSFVKEFINV